MTVKLFNDDARHTYTKEGSEVSDKLYVLIEAEVDKLLKEGYNLRTVMGPLSSKPTVDASGFDADPLEFHAVWIGALFDVTLTRLLGI